MDIYKFDIHGSDLEIENYTLVTSRNQIYISDSYSINVIGEDKYITEIKLIVQSDDDILTDLVFEFPNSKHLDVPIDRLIEGHLNKDKELTILLEYKLNGVQKEHYHTVNLEKNKIDYE